MGNLGGMELLVIFLIALMVLGPSKLPEAARQIGRAVTELRRVSGGFQRELRDALEEPMAETKALIDNEVADTKAMIDNEVAQTKAMIDSDVAQTEAMTDNEDAAPATTDLSGPPADTVDTDRD